MKSSSPYTCIAAEGFPHLRSKTAPGMARKYLQAVMMELNAEGEQRLKHAKAKHRQVKDKMIRSRTMRFLRCAAGIK